MARGKKAAKALTPEERLEQALVPVEEQPYPIPENWCWVTIGAIASVKGGKRIPKGNKLVEYKTDHPYIRVTDFDNLSIATEQVKYIDEETFKLIRNYTISTQDVYISIAGTIGKVGIIPDDLDGANLTENAAKITNIRGVEKNFLLWLLESEVAQSQMRDATISTTQPKLALFRIENVKFPLSPLTEQQRIVSRIESLFAKLDEAKEKAQAVVDGFELRKSAILHKAFTGELTERWRKEHEVRLDSWKRKKYSELCSIVRGGSPRPAGNPEFYNGNIPFMKVADITRNPGPYVNSTEYTIKEAGLKKTRMVRANTLLLTNSGATLGVPAICTFDTTFNDGIAAFLGLNSECLLFHYYFWMSKTAELRAINKGAAQPNLNTDIIGSVEVDMPREAEQKEIIHILDKLIEKEQQAKEAAEAVLDQIDTMKKAILARAFRGELGTNDPAEEWAGELLKENLPE